MLKTRGEQRFASLTYSQVARWTGLRLSTVQSYGAKGRIDMQDMVGMLQWIDEQCRRRHRPAPWEEWRLRRLANRLARELGFWCYKDYLASELWQDIRSRLLPAECRRCGGPANQVHHKKYTLENMSGESLKGLMPVCQPCHGKMHSREEDDPETPAGDDPETPPGCGTCTWDTAPQKPPPHIVRGDDGKLYLRANSG